MIARFPKPVKEKIESSLAKLKAYLPQEPAYQRKKRSLRLKRDEDAGKDKPTQDSTDMSTEDGTGMLVEDGTDMPTEDGGSNEGTVTDKSTKKPDNTAGEPTTTPKYSKISIYNYLSVFDYEHRFQDQIPDETKTLLRIWDAYYIAEFEVKLCICLSNN